MAWTSPMTAVSGAVLTAAQWNTNVRDNLLETAPAKATAGGQFIVSTAANAIAARPYAFARQLVGTSTGETLPAVAAFTFSNLATVGPSVTVTTGTSALVFFGANAGAVVANVSAIIGVAVSGATTIANTFTNAYGSVGNATGATVNDAIISGVHSFSAVLNSGSNTFTMQYASNTASATPVFRNRWILVFPF